MQLGFLATLTALVVSHVYARPVEDVLTPSGIPATSADPLTSIPFLTPTADPSMLSAISSLISSESTAIYPLTATLTGEPSSSVSMPTTTTSPTVTSTSTGAARRLALGSSEVTGISLVLGVITFLVCS